MADVDPAAVAAAATATTANTMIPNNMATSFPSKVGRPKGHPFTHTTCFSVWTISTRSDWAAITASMSL